MRGENQLKETAKIQFTPSCLEAIQGSRASSTTGSPSWILQAVRSSKKARAPYRSRKAKTCQGFVIYFAVFRLRMESPIKPELANGSGQESPKLAAGFGDRKNPPHKSLSLGAGFFQFYTRFRVFELNSLFISFRRVVPLIISDFTLYRVRENAQHSF